MEFWVRAVYTPGICRVNIKSIPDARDKHFLPFNLFGVGQENYYYFLKFNI